MVTLDLQSSSWSISSTYSLYRSSPLLIGRFFLSMLYNIMYVYITMCVYSMHVYISLMPTNKKWRTERYRRSGEISERDVCIKQVLIIYNLSPNLYILSICHEYTVLLPFYMSFMENTLQPGFLYCKSYLWIPRANLTQLKLTIVFFS